MHKVRGMLITGSRITYLHVFCTPNESDCRAFGPPFGIAHCSRRTSSSRAALLSDTVEHCGHYSSRPDKPEDGVWRSDWRGLQSVVTCKMQDA